MTHSAKRIAAGLYEYREFSIEKIWSDGYGWSWYMHGPCELEPTVTLADAKASIDRNWYA